ncbi:N-succinylglutamate 5-semialdehyde dehydrogenase, partial [Pseudomonas aeruginosa]
ISVQAFREPNGEKNRTHAQPNPLQTQKPQCLVAVIRTKNLPGQHPNRHILPADLGRKFLVLNAKHDNPKVPLLTVNGLF